MSRALTKDDLLRKRSVQREIPGLGTVTLQSVTVGQIKEAEETSAENSDTKDHSSFVNYVLSKMISDPPLSMEHVGALSGETLFGLLAEAADVMGVRQEFDEAESDFEGRERLYEAYRRRMAALADSLQTAASQGYTEITKQFEESIDGAMRKAIEAIGKSRPSLDQYHLPALRMPEPHVADFSVPDIPTPEERNEYQSAGFLMRRLADSIIQWRQQLPSDQQPAILAVLNGGTLISVERLAEESFHGIRLEGKLADTPCMILAHQATIQLLCYIEKVEKEEHRRRIGFIIDGKEEQI